MERKLPVFNIKGTDFLVDIENQELREVSKPSNTIPFIEMRDERTHYEFNYDHVEKNLPSVLTDGFSRVKIPQMIELDPIGMTAKYNVKLEDLSGKCDFDFLVNQDLLNLRLSGALPIIEIMEHPFYVDLRMAVLRPKDDFSTKGIEFSNLGEHTEGDQLKYYLIYDPNSHTTKEIDYTSITAIPSDLFLIEIPNEKKLDPVGYSRISGWEMRSCLRENPIQANMKAKIIPWKETELPQIIKENLKKKLQNKEHQLKVNNKKKGRSL
jgi:hypothetical protein